MKLTVFGIMIAALVGTSPAFAQISSKAAGQQLQNQGSMVDTLSAKKKKKTKKMDDSMGTGNTSKSGASVDKDDSQKSKK